MEWKIGYYEGIETTVMVSDNGHVVHRNKGYEISANRNSSGCLTCMIGLLTNEKKNNNKLLTKYKCVAVHRLVLSTFFPINSYEKMQGDHLNKNKLDNRVTNLEWVTRSENLKRRYKLDYTPSGCGDIPKKKVIKICKMLAVGKSFDEIFYDTGISTDIIRSIFLRDICTEIGDQYIFRLPPAYTKTIICPYDTTNRNGSSGEDHFKTNLSIDDVKCICELLETNKYTVGEIANIIGTTKAAVQGIRRGESWSYISKNYNIHIKTRFMPYRRLIYQMKAMGYNCREITSIICPDEIDSNKFFVVVRSYANLYLIKKKDKKLLGIRLNKLSSDELEESINKAYHEFLKLNPWLVK